VGRVPDVCGKGFLPDESPEYRIERRHNSRWRSGSSHVARPDAAFLAWNHEASDDARTTNRGEDKKCGG